MNLLLIIPLLAVFFLPTYSPESRNQMLPDLKSYINSRLTEFDQIPSERKLLLDQLAEHVNKCTDQRKPSKLLFVCTHNSRRSHLSQAWAQVAAAQFGIPGVECFSGGTEATAFNPRTVAAMRRAGFAIEVAKADEAVANPKYLVKFSSNENPVVYFSKRTGEAPNPSEAFAAIMTCSEADKACPTVSGCSFRLALPFDDPKVSDGTAEESATYDLRCRQIARELLYTMSRVKQRRE
jgi:arsenate reductase (thioredoxin)